MALALSLNSKSTILCKSSWEPTVIARVSIALSKFIIILPSSVINPSDSLKDSNKYWLALGLAFKKSSLFWYTSGAASVYCPIISTSSKILSSINASKFSFAALIFLSWPSWNTGANFFFVFSKSSITCKL